MSEFIPSPYLACEFCTHRHEQGHETSHIPTLFHICWKLSVSRCQSSLEGLVPSSPVSCIVCQLFSLQCNPRIELNAQDTGKFPAQERELPVWGGDSTNYLKQGRLIFSVLGGGGCGSMHSLCVFLAAPVFPSWARVLPGGAALVPVPEP